MHSWPIFISKVCGVGILKIIEVDVEELWGVVERSDCFVDGLYEVEGEF